MFSFLLFFLALPLSLIANTNFEHSNNYEYLKANGVEYGVTIRNEHPNPVVLYHLIVDPKKAQIVLAASESCGDALPTSQLAENNNVLAAINGGFWDFQAYNHVIDRMLRCLRILGLNTYDAYPVFASKIGDQWHAISKERTEVGPALNGLPVARLGILGWNDEGDAVIGHCATSFMVYFDGNPFPVNDLNKPRALGAILYTPTFKKKRPQKRKFIDVIVRNGRVVDKRRGGESLVPADGFVYSAPKKKVDQIAIGDEAELSLSFLSPDIEPATLKNMTYLRGTIPVLLLNGEILPTIRKSKSEFSSMKHPRTAVGLFPDGRWLLVVVDGRQDHSIGMSLLELAQYFKDVGCISAINLDGGGSSTMIVGGKLVNSPSGDTVSIRRGPSMERPVSDAILILARE